MTFNELLELDKKTGARPVRPRKKPVPPAPDQTDTKKATKAIAMKDTTQPGNRDTMPPRHHGVITASTLHRLRKAVKVIGKEAATHRFTPEEKDLLADIVYTYSRQGYRTSENEVVRIGVNWLIIDYQENGRQSVLHKVLKALMS